MSKQNKQANKQSQESVIDKVATDLEQSFEKTVADPATGAEYGTIETEQAVVDAAKTELKEMSDKAVEEAKQEVQKPVVEAKPAKVDTNADGLQLSVFANRVAFVKEHGTVEEQQVLSILEGYVDVCSKSIDLNKIAQQQQRLWRMFEYIHNKPDQFQKLFGLVIEFAREYKDNVFDIANIYRAQEALTISADQLQVFTALRQLVVSTVKTKNKADVKRLIDIKKIMDMDGVPEHIRGFYVAYYEA